MFVLKTQDILDFSNDFQYLKPKLISHTSQYSMFVLKNLHFHRYFKYFTIFKTQSEPSQIAVFPFYPQNWRYCQLLSVQHLPQLLSPIIQYYCQYKLVKLLCCTPFKVSNASVPISNPFNLDTIPVFFHAMNNWNYQMYQISICLKTYYVECGIGNSSLLYTQLAKVPINYSSKHCNFILDSLYLYLYHIRRTRLCLSQVIFLVSYLEVLLSLYFWIVESVFSMSRSFTT